MAADWCEAFTATSEPNLDQQWPNMLTSQDVGSGLIAGRLFSIGFDLALRQAQVGALIVRAQINVRALSFCATHTIGSWYMDRC